MVLRDESVVLTPLSVLKAIGHGQSKPAAIARHLELKQSSLSTPLKQLLDSGLIAREVPYGESAQNAKKTLYSIVDPALSFWFHVYEPHVTRWPNYDYPLKEKLINAQAAELLERAYRQSFPGAMRYWEGDAIEFDCVRPSDNAGNIIIEELKWRPLTAAARSEAMGKLRHNFARSLLGRKYPEAQLAVLDGDEAIACVTASPGF